MHLSPWEIIVVLAIVLLLFGVGRISKIGGELGSGIRAFQKGLKGNEEEQDKTAEDTVEAEKK
jgi:sec-independent protein translocase protein TatA